MPLHHLVYARAADFGRQGLTREGLLKTLHPEHMYVEAIFRDRDQNPTVLFAQRRLDRLVGLV